MNNYKPMVGSVAFRAIAHLKTLAPGEEIATGPLSDAIELDKPDTLGMYLTPALNAGVISRRIKPELGRMNWWRLGAGEGFVPVPMTPPRPAPSPPLLVGGRLLCDGCTRSICFDKGCMDGRLSQVTAEPAPTPAPTPEPAPALADASTTEEVGAEVDELETEEAAADFNACVWADGEVTIYGAQENVDGSVTLSVDQAKVLRKLIAWLPA